MRRGGAQLRELSRTRGSLWVARRAWDIVRIEGLAGARARMPRNARTLQALSADRSGGLLREVVTLDGVHEVPDRPVTFVIHAFYLDVFADIVDILRTLDFDYRLCVSVTTEHDREGIEQLARRLPRATLEVCVVENRGRDAAPLLLTFGHRLRERCYLCHLHTKKSLHAGRERNQWRDHLFRFLIADRRHRARAIDQLVRNPDVGLVYPETYDMLSHWTHAWISNRAAGQWISQRLGVAFPDCYVDAPMGSMFWARSEALAPLLDLQLSLEDFPPEQGQTDGALQHAIERCYVLCAERAGLQYRVVSEAPGGATVFSNVGGKNLERYYARRTRDQIVAAARGAQWVSFDLFDTLVTHPFQTLADLERHVAACVARGDDEGTSLARLLRPRGEVCRAARELRRRGMRLALIADTELPASTIRRVLRACDLELFDELLLSSETGVRKDNGSAWRRLPAQLGVDPGALQHVGDDEHADVRMALESGLRPPAHVLRASDIFHNLNEGSPVRPPAHNWQESFLLGTLSQRLAEDIDRTGLAVDAYENRIVRLPDAQEAGYRVMGPLLSCIVAWTLQCARDDGVADVLYADSADDVLARAHVLVIEHPALARCALSFARAGRAGQQRIPRAASPCATFALTEEGSDHAQAFRYQLVDSRMTADPQQRQHAALRVFTARQDAGHDAVSRCLPLLKALFEDSSLGAQDAAQRAAWHTGALAYVSDAVELLDDAFVELHAGRRVVQLPLTQLMVGRWRLDPVPRWLTAVIGG